MITNSELKKLAKDKNLTCEHSEGLFHEYFHIKGDDENGFEGRSTDEFTVVIMIQRNKATLDAARMAAKAAIETLPKFKLGKNKKLSKKKLETAPKLEYNAPDDLKSETKNISEKVLRSSLF